MLANLLPDRINLIDRALYCFRAGTFAGNPDGKEDRPEAALFHPRDIDTSQSVACADIETAVQKSLRGVVVRVHNYRRKVELPCMLGDVLRVTALHPHHPRH